MINPTNPIIINAVADGGFFKIKGFKSEGAEVNLLIYQKASSIASEILDLVGVKRHVKQINFEFYDDKSIKVFLEYENGRIEKYNNSRLSQDSIIRRLHLINLIQQVRASSLTALAQIQTEINKTGIANENTGDYILKRSENKSIITSLFICLKKWFVFNCVINLDVKKFKFVFFGQVRNELDLRGKIKISQKEIDGFVYKLQQELEGRGLSGLFSKDELLTTVSSSLAKEFSLKLKKITGKILSRQEISVLENEIKIGKFISDFENAVSDFQKIEIQNQKKALNDSLIEDKEKEMSTSLDKLKEIFDLIPAIEFPIERLAYLPVNPITENSLIHIWNRILTELVDQGDLKNIALGQRNPTLTFKQVPYADAYLLACQLLPKELRGAFQDFNKEDISKIESFIQSQPNALSLRSLPQTDLQKKGRRIFQDFIRPVIDEVKNEYNQDHDFTKIAELLVKNSQSPSWDAFINKIERKLNTHNISKDERVSLKLTRNDLINYLIHDLEQIGLDRYSITNEQIIRLRECRSLASQQGAVELTGIEILIGEVSAVPMPDFSSPSTSLRNSKQLNELEIRGLQILTKAIASIDQKKKSKLSHDEDLFLQQFIRYAQKPGPQSKALNAKLKEMIKEKDVGITKSMFGNFFNSNLLDGNQFSRIPFGISQDAVDLMLGVTYKLRYAQQFQPLVDKLDHLLNKIDQGEEIANVDKMTLKELGILTKCAELGEDETGLLTKLQVIGSTKTDPSITEFSQASAQAKVLLLKLNKKFQKEALSNYRNGDFIAYIGKKKFEFYDHKASFDDQLHLSLITPFSHGAKIYIEKGTNQVKLSHVVGEYEQSTLDFTENCYSEGWRLDIQAMIPQEQHEVLKEVYGEDWAVEIQKKYEIIENKIHQNEKKQFSDLKNPWERRFEAGKADYIWRGHVKKGETDFNHLAKRILGESKEGEDHLSNMICSEFVTKTSLTALVVLNRKLSEEISNHLWKKGKYDQATELREKKNFFKLPISNKESLKRVHPGRMIDLFKQRNCIKRVKPLQIVEQIVRLV